ncbi:MAG: hemerythrin domain-containing protein [Candidatus Omnitrophica bacterium]|nr:hemerythrin domain-containing protein [Candidatus Omnitrophota bacterium]
MAIERITEFYAKDHDELDWFLKQFQAFKRQDFDKAKPFFRSFKFGLQRHILWEEEILFPVFESKTGMKDSSPTAVMRHEHILIKEALEDLHGKVREHDPDSDIEEKTLIDILSQHNLKEESMLYPAIDKITSDQEKKELFDQMRALPEARYGRCECHGH